jgi:hypothetical protein
MRIASFLSCESGAITVDWTVLTAGLAGLGLASMSVVSGGVQNLSEDISAFLQRDLSLFVRFDVNRISNASFEDIEGMLAAGWGFYNADGSLAGWTNLADYQAEVVHSGYMGVHATDGDFMLDLDASPGNMMLGQVIAGALDGQPYTVSFDAADRVGNNGVAVYWGGELVGTVDPGSGMESYSFEIIGGSGDGSNQLMIGGTGPEDNRGAFIDNIAVHS